MPGKPKGIDEYLAAVSAEQRGVLEKLRRTIHTAAPGAEEYIGYGLAGFKFNGRPLVYFGAWEHHCALYAASPAVQKKFHKELKDFEVSKGTIKFTPEKPLPMTLVKKLVQARVAENIGNTRLNTAATQSVKISANTKLKSDVQSVLTDLKRLGNPRFREEMETRYGIITKDAFGVRMNEMQRVAKQLGRNHALALALWETGNYEARTVGAFVTEPERVTPELMDRWCRDFDNWAICDTVCFKLFDRTPHAYDKVAQWAERKDVFQKRAAFALLACLALHDKDADDEVFTDFLPLIEAAATDERNFVKKGVSWALRVIGRRCLKLHAAAVKVAQRLKASPSSSARWIGSDVLRDITRPVVARRLAKAVK